MDTLREPFGRSVGFSDHTLGIRIALAAAARGAAILEKHFTLDKDLPGPEHRVSLETGEVAGWPAGAIRRSALGGDGCRARSFKLPGDKRKGVARPSAPPSRSTVSARCVLGCPLADGCQNLPVSRAVGLYRAILQ